EYTLNAVTSPPVILFTTLPIGTQITILPNSNPNDTGVFYGTVDTIGVLYDHGQLFVSVNTSDQTISISIPQLGWNTNYQVGDIYLNQGPFTVGDKFVFNGRVQEYSSATEESVPGGSDYMTLWLTGFDNNYTIGYSLDPVTAPPIIRYTALPSESQIIIQPDSNPYDTDVFYDAQYWQYNKGILYSNGDVYLGVNTSNQTISVSIPQLIGWNWNEYIVNLPISSISSSSSSSSRSSSSSSLVRNPSSSSIISSSSSSKKSSSSSSSRISSWASTTSSSSSSRLSSTSSARSSLVSSAISTFRSSITSSSSSRSSSRAA
ncbi:MAG: hypothetical protein V1703_03750, partial [Candidatus Altiarchaeota archaeon]